MKKVDMIPNYYAYTLKTNGRYLSEEQRIYFFNRINKIYRNNDKFLYRGDKKDKLYTIYRLDRESSDERFRDICYSF